MPRRIVRATQGASARKWGVSHCADQTRASVRSPEISKDMRGPLGDVSRWGDRATAGIQNI